MASKVLNSSSPKLGHFATKKTNVNNEIKIFDDCGSPKPKKFKINNNKSLGSENSGSPTPSYSRVWQQLPKTNKPQSKLFSVDFSCSALSRIAGSKSPAARVSPQELITKHNPYNYETAIKKIPLIDLSCYPK